MQRAKRAQDVLEPMVTFGRRRRVPRVCGRRASRGAADMLLAKLYLNAQVYTGTARWSEARTAAEAVIAGGYTLDDDYLDMFLADNHTSPELVFTVPQDGITTRS